MLRVFRRQHEGRFRIAEFGGDLLHGAAVETAGIGNDGQGLPTKRSDVKTSTVT